MTKTLFKAALAATVATGLFASPAMAADTETFSATARIVKPLVLTNVDDLDFGTITMLPTLTSDVVVVGRAGGAVASSCGADLACTAPTPASFTVAGSASQALTVSIVAPATLDSGLNTVAFSVDAPASVTLDGLGATSFEIGGSITVLSTTVDGTYTNTVDVTVEYS